MSQLFLSRDSHFFLAFSFPSASIDGASYSRYLNGQGNRQTDTFHRESCIHLTYVCSHRLWLL